MAYQDPYYNSSNNEPYRQRFNEHLNSYYSQETHPTYDYDPTSDMDNEAYNRPLPAAPNGRRSVLTRSATGKERPYVDESFTPPSNEKYVFIDIIILFVLIHIECAEIQEVSESGVVIIVRVFGLRQVLLTTSVDHRS